MIKEKTPDIKHQEKRSPYAPQLLPWLDLLHKPSGLHLVDDLLLRFGLAHEVGVRTCGRDKSREIEVSNGAEWVNIQDWKR
jgi:hypothetical protein